LNIEKEWDVSQFDAIIGNPPYNVDQGKQGNKPIYNLFIEYYIDKCIYLLFVIPSRWFVSGKGLDKFRDFMLERKDIELIEHEDDSQLWFGKVVNIEGGVHYFLKNSHYHGMCKFNGKMYDLRKYDIIIKPEYMKLVDKLKDKPSIETIYMGSPFGIKTNDKRLKKKGDTKCYVSLFKSANRVMYVDHYKMKPKNEYWKVFTSEANGNSPSFGYMNVGSPPEIHSNSYISFRVNNRKEAESLMSYLKTKFANYMLSIRKISQHISQNTCKWIPIVPLDREWTDKKVYTYFHLTPQEIKTIEKKY
jgi:site-specific DNA-methyltransferase (adenine-specific)